MQILQNNAVASNLIRRAIRCSRRLAPLSIMVTLLFAFAQPACAISKEYQVKLAYLYKFALYVTWPADKWALSQDALVVGIMGEDPFGPALDVVAGKKPNGKRVVVKYFRGPDDYEPCDILYVSRSVGLDTLALMAKNTDNSPVLIVGDSPGPGSDPAVFAFYLDAEGRVGIRMNVDAAERRGLRTDARLMQVCDIVRDQKK